MTDPTRAEPTRCGPGTRRAWFGGIVSRLLLLAFGTVLAVLVLEAVLQIGAAFVGVRPSVQPSSTGHLRRILCLGDSNTYGLYLDKSQSYPRVLERLLNPPAGPRTVQVLDMGYPVVNSSKVLREFDRMLLAFRPDVVTVMIGANDFWTVPVGAEESPRLRDRVAWSMWKWSRVYRFFYMLAHAPRAPHVDVGPRREGHVTVNYEGYEFKFGGQMAPKGSQPFWSGKEVLERNLAILPARAKEFGAQLVFVTYASEKGFYGAANSIMGAAARDTKTPLVDVGAQFQSMCMTPCPYFFRDQHPNAAGYEQVAQILKQHLAELPNAAR